jgi:elongation factor P
LPDVYWCKDSVTSHHYSKGKEQEIMAEVQTLRKGDIYEEEGQLWRVQEFQHIKMARGSATIRLKLRNVRSGSNVERTYNNGERVQEVELERDDVQYQYTDGELFYFMNTETYEQVALTRESLEGVLEFIGENQVVTLESYAEEPISVIPPQTVDLKVVWADISVVGDTAAGAPSKLIELETGYRMQAPMFVNVGEVIRINTRDRAYVTRVKQ